MNIPVMLRQARKAVAQEAFAEAERLYALVLQDKDMQDMIDIKIRYGFCLEKTENINAAIQVYQSVVQVYQTQGEAGAAKALELKIAILGKLLAKETEVDVADETQSEMESARQHLDVMFEGNETTNFNDIDLFGLGTLEIVPKQEIVDDTEHHVVLDLVPIEEEKHVMDKTHVSTVELIIAHEKTVVAQAESKKDSQDKASLVVIQDMIKKGIHQNVTHNSDKEGEDIVFTDIGDFTPQLPSGAACEQGDNATSELNLQDKAGDLFGK
ncbi:MAG: hypothetical protein Q9M75_02305 [Ghiorsea sp.]|nr:hypothetical protein [Ghiorsea sp.]